MSTSGSSPGRAVRPSPAPGLERHLVDTWGVAAVCGPGKLQVHSRRPELREVPQGGAGKTEAAIGSGNPVLREWVRGGASGSAPPERPKGVPMANQSPRHVRTEASTHSARSDQAALPGRSLGSAQRRPGAQAPFPLTPSSGAHGSPLCCPVPRARSPRPLARPCLPGLVLRNLGSRMAKEGTEWDWIFATSQSEGGRQAQFKSQSRRDSAP